MNMIEKWKKRLNIFLAVMMVVTSFNFGAVTAFAATPENPLLDVPDQTLRQAILYNIIGDKNRSDDGDTKYPLYKNDLPTIEAAKSLDLLAENLVDDWGGWDYPEDVSNLKGIEYLKSLETLKMGACEVKEADFSGNLKLKNLDAKNCRYLTSLNLKANTELETLDISGTKIRSLDLSKNTKLKSVVGGIEDTISTIASDNKYRVYISDLVDRGYVEDAPLVQKIYSHSKEEEPVRKTDLQGREYVEFESLDKILFDIPTGNPSFPIKATYRVGKMFGPNQTQITDFIITNNPNKMVYAKGDPLDLQGIYFIASGTAYGSERKALLNLSEFKKMGGTVTSDGAAIEEGTAVNEDKTIDFKLNGVTRSLNITIDPNAVKKEIESIEVVKTPTKKSYYSGVALNLSGLSVQINYNDNTSETVDYSKFAANGIEVKLIRGEEELSTDTALQKGDTSIKILKKKLNSDETVSVTSEFFSVINKYTVTFDLEGKGTVSNSDQKYLKVKLDEGKKIVRVPVVKSNPGYSFLGWITGDSTDVLNDDAVKAMDITQDTTFKAVYSTASGSLME